MKKPNQQEMQSVARLNGSKRVEYLVKRVADEELVWSLKNSDGWSLCADANGQECVPVWPNEAFAAQCAINQWADCVATSIPLEAWLSRWQEGMMKDNRNAAVFPVADGAGVSMPIVQFNELIRNELTKYD